jgi:hypothetical protein
VLDGFEIDVNSHDALELYLVGKANPKAFKGVTLQKMINYHPLIE